MPVRLLDRAQGVRRNLIGITDIAGIVGERATITAIGPRRLHGGGAVGHFTADAHHLARAVRRLEAPITGIEVLAPVMPKKQNVKAAALIHSAPAAEKFFW